MKVVNVVIWMAGGLQHMEFLENATAWRWRWIDCEKVINLISWFTMPLLLCRCSLIHFSQVWFLCWFCNLDLVSYGQHLTLGLLILWVQWSKVEKDEVIKVIAPRECKVLYWIEFKFERRLCFDAENWIFQGLGNILYSRYHHSIRPGQEPLEICRVTFEVIIHSICWESDKVKDRRSRLSLFTWTGNS